MSSYIDQYQRPMGILKLMDFLKAKHPQCIYPRSLNAYKGQRLVIDASNWIYQFLIKTQTIRGQNVEFPVDWMGNQTGHLLGILARIELCFQHGITPVWVFDGKPPAEKSEELRRRKKKREKAQDLQDQAREDGDVFELLKMSKRVVKISEQEKQDAKNLIKLIGLPVIQSPSQAEPQCAQIVKQAFAYGILSEDMDNLVFGCTHLIKNFNKKNQIQQISLPDLLELTGFSQEEFIDFCILCGCDYTSKINRIGPVKAYSLLKQHKDIEGVMEFIMADEKRSNSFVIPEDFNHLKARQLFMNPEVSPTRPEDVQMSEFKQEQFVQFLTEKQFSAQRISNWLERVKKTSMLHY